MRKLRELNLDDTQVSEEGILKLRASLPTLIKTTIQEQAKPSGGLSTTK
jgi:hypothetical protein